MIVESAQTIQGKENLLKDKDKRLKQLCSVIEYFYKADATVAKAKIHFGNKEETNYIPSRTIDNHIYFLRRLNEKFGNPLPTIMPKEDVNPHKYRSYQYMDSDEHYFLLLSLLSKLGQFQLENDGNHPAFKDIHKMLADAPDQGLNKKADYSYLELLNKIHYKSSEIDAEPSFSMAERQLRIMDCIMQICLALLKNKSLKCSYSNRSGDLKDLQLLPYTLLRYNESWYMIAAGAEEPQSYRCYKVNRIRRIETGEPFTSPDPTVLKAYLKKLDAVFGIDADLSKPTRTARIRISQEAEQLIKGIKWSKKQAFTRDEQGLIISVDYKNSGELLGRILRYGEFAEVVEPPELREEWLGRIRKMAQKYLG